MLKKISIIFLLFFYFLFAKNDLFLEPKDAFKTMFIQKENGIFFSIKLGKSIYLYKNRLKVFILKPQKVEITKDLFLPKGVKYEDFIVYFNDILIEIPKKVLQSKIKTNNYTLEVQFQGCSKSQVCYAPISKTITLNFNNKFLQNDHNQGLKNSSFNETDEIIKTLSSGNIFLILMTFFGFGLLLSLTPCIFPMIPILSSIIIKRANSEKLSVTKSFFLSFIYVFFMALAYTIVGVIAGLFGENLQIIFQNFYVIITFSLIFVALSLSMFGYYKLQLPQNLQNRVDKIIKNRDKKGVISIALMGFFSALIVGPCIAPPLASALIYISKTGDAILGGVALFILGLGMGMPLLLIGLGAGKFMPKPGKWMDNISKIFGIIMLCIAIWMLEKVIPKYTLFLWAMLLIGSALYFQIYKHLIIRVISTLIFIYGIICFIGAISGATSFLHPLDNFIRSNKKLQKEDTLIWTKINNLDELKVAIKNSSKPVMLDFYATWCVSCNELEQVTFKDKDVISKLKDFTLLKADVTENRAEHKILQKKYGIFGPPAIIFWDKNNKEIKPMRIIGYKNPKAFLEVLNYSF